MFRLITYKKAAHPYYHEKMTIHIYSIEELCYYLEKNIYLIDEDWIGEELSQWIEQELEIYELAAGLRSMARRKKTVYERVLYILQFSGFYSSREQKTIQDMLEAMEGKTVMERRKMRADLLFHSGKYRQAAYIYMELLEPEYSRRMTEELKGNIMHNLGVIYARMFLFDEAARLFSAAYQLSHNDKSKECYLYALNFLDDTDSFQDNSLNLNFPDMREALNHVSETADQPEYFVERKAASNASEAYDWKLRQTDLIRRWKEDYIAMIS